MRQKWKELGVSSIPLPNKDNAAVLEALDNGESNSEDYEEFEQAEEPVSEALSVAMLHRQRIAHDSTYFGESGASDLNRLQGCKDASGSNGPVIWCCADESGASDLNQCVNEIVKRAKHVTKGGGIRTGNLMRKYFRNKDKKKGQQDTFKNHGKHTLGRTVSYPDTLNTCYSSYLEAVAVTIAHPQFYIGYLEDVRDRKINRRFNHLESNIYKVLQDKSTLTKLAVLALYQEAVSHSYILAVRGKENKPKNALDLGPLHKKVRTHIARLICELSIILSLNADPV
ncbi:hypothetical protein ACEPAI_9153 [Sanghuangporus weigelae]